MRQRLSVLLFAISLFFAFDNDAMADSKKASTKYDFRPSIMTKTGPQISGCGWSLDHKALSQSEICDGIKKKIELAWLNDSNKALRENLNDKKLSCWISLNGGGAVIELKIRESSGSKMLDEQILELIRTCGYFKINRTLNLEDHFYIVDLPTLDVKASMN